MAHKKRGVGRRASTDAPTPSLNSPLSEPCARDRRVGIDRQALGLIARQALFTGVPFDTLEPLVEGCEIRELRVGDVVLSPGQANRSLYLLLEGKLEVHIDRVDAETGFSIAPGECAGEISIIDGKPATAFVVAEEPSRVLVIPEAALWQDFLKIPQIAKNFMRLFADRFRARNQVMQEALEQQLRYEHLRKELAIAHDIQLGMLPRELDLEPEIDIAAEMTPAQQVGGDFYDAFPIGADEYCVAIGDVSGKGVPAALFMVRTVTLLRTEMLKDQPMDEAVRRLNIALCDENPACMFATLVVGVLNKRTGGFRYVNAGHDPILFGKGGAAFRALPAPAGILVGVAERATYEIASIKLASGDVLVLYTDGVTEAMNHEGELYGAKRLLGCLERKPAFSAWDVADRINLAVQRFAAGAPPSDDLTMVIVRFRGSGAVSDAVSNGA